MNLTHVNRISALTEFLSACPTEQDKGVHKMNQNTLNNNRGAALVEMALILPLLMLIIFGIFEFGRAMYITNTLNNAAREGARRAAVSPAPIDVEAYVKSCIPFDKTGLAISTNPSAPSSGASVTVTVTQPFQTITCLTPMLDGKILRGEASMRYEL